MGAFSDTTDPIPIEGSPLTCRKGKIEAGSYDVSDEWVCGKLCAA